MIYMACFLLSALFANFAYKTDNKRKVVFFSIISILIMVLLAGLRDFSIGIDVENYQTYKYYWAGAYFAEDFYTYMKYYLTNGHNEIFFALFMALIKLTTNSFRVFVFLSHLIIITFIYIGAYRQRRRINPAFLMLLFYFCFFHHSLNVIRQYIAMSIIFMFLVDLEDGKYFRYIVAVIIAMLFHNTAILALGAVLIHMVLYSKLPELVVEEFPIVKEKLLHLKEFLVEKYSIIKKKLPRLNGSLIEKFSILKEKLPRLEGPLKNRMKFIIISLSILVVIFKPLCLVLMKVGILSSKYQFYMNGENIEYGGIVSILLVLELALTLYLWKKLEGKDDKFEFYFTNSACYFILYQLSAFIAFGKRIAIYYCLNNLVTLSFIGNSQEDEKKKRILNLGILAFVILYWLYIFIFRAASETYPYSIFGHIIY